jgi:peptide/nickel transport system ATP-binding protein
MTQDDLLSIHDLSIALPQGGDRACAVDGVSISVKRNEIVCLVGESGSGKSLTAHAVLGLLPERVKLAGGGIDFNGRNIATLDEASMHALRGNEIAMIFQDPLSALNPLMRIGRQIAEAMRSHATPLPADGEIKKRVLDLITAVSLPDPAEISRRYPFELSGGQRQRVMIAIAMANNPALLLADEPTTALDVTTQKLILALIKKMQTERGMGVLLITHDFGVVEEMADRVVVMRHGKVVEQGAARDVIQFPQHPYTRALIESVPGTRLPPPRAETQRLDPILRVAGLSKTFTQRTGFLAVQRVAAVNNVNMHLTAGETVAIVGESGSGKSTLGRLIMRLLEPDSGTVSLDGGDFLKLRGEALRRGRKMLQIIFQDPFAALNPRQKVGDAIARGPIAYGVAENVARTEARRLLVRVGLRESAADRYPHEFSGGQRQRICIARALALKPRVIIADESVSALDVSVQKTILELLQDLQNEMDLAILFITHDLRVAAEIADRIVVMRRGEIVEQGATSAVFGNPRHEYTRQLLSAVPGRELFRGPSGDAAPHRGVAIVQ